MINYSALVSVDLSDARLALAAADRSAAAGAVTTELRAVQPSLLRELKQLLGAEVQTCYIPDIDGVEHELERVLQLALKRHLVNELEQWPDHTTLLPGYDAEGTTLVIVVSRKRPDVPGVVTSNVRARPQHLTSKYEKLDSTVRSPFLRVVCTRT
jgi:hypothetical protein